MAGLVQVFEEQTGYDLNVSAGSTGSLYTQIRNGAPYDVFLAADQARPQRLEADGLVAGGQLFTYAIGQLTLWQPNEKDTGPAALSSDSVRHIAIANPELAPYGAAAMEVLHALDLGRDIEGKLVRAENVGQAFAYVQTGNAELGFVAVSQVLTLGPDESGTRWDPPQELYTPVRQDVVLLKRAADNQAALAFTTFLRGEEARAIIERAGYRTP